MKKLKALVIDDSRIMRTMVVRSLRLTELADFKFVEAEDGVDALEKLNGQDASDVQIIFADWNMPRMSGIELVSRIRKAKKFDGIPIVMVTSEQTVGKMDDALGRAGAAAYVCKPFTVPELTRKLRPIIQDIPEPGARMAGFFNRLLGA